MQPFHLLVPRFRIALLVAVTTVAITAGATSARAASCWGDWCSGQDPMATGCANGAYAVAHLQLPWVSQRLELRWSPTCQTNWARIVGDPNPSWLKAVQLPTR